MGLALVLLALACHRGPAPGAGDGEAVLRVASQKGGTKAMLTASGALAGIPYRIEWAEFPAAQHLLEALGAGAVDVGAIGDAPFQFAYQAGSPIKAVQAIRYKPRNSSVAVVVRAGSAARTLADLKGQTVATGRGSVGHYLLLRALERDGLRPDDIHIAFMSPGDAKAAFSSGAIAAWSTWNPYVAAATLHEGARVLVDGRDLVVPTGFMAASGQAIAGKRALLEDFLKRNARAQAWTAGHLDEFAATLAQETGLPLDVARATAEIGRQGAVPIDAPLLDEQRTLLAHFERSGALHGGRALEAGFDTTLFSADVVAAKSSE